MAFDGRTRRSFLSKKVGFWGTIGVVTCTIISEGSWIAFPPRNLIPVL
jgi:hypothetical protein